MEVVAGGGISNSEFSMKHIEENLSGGKSFEKKIRRKNKKKLTKELSEDYDEEGESFEKVITKTKITIKKGRKKKKGGKGKGEEGDEYEDYEEEGGEYKRNRQVGVYSLYISGNVTVKHRIPKPAVCHTWNGNKVKTFDGLIYKRNLYCAHVLVTDRKDGTFTINLRSCPRGAKQPCPHAIDITMLGTKYAFENLGKEIENNMKLCKTFE